MVAPVVRVKISLAVSRRGQALRQRRFIRAASPGEPAKIARLNAVVNVPNYGPDRYAGQALLVQCYRVKVAPVRCARIHSDADSCWCAIGEAVSGPISEAVRADVAGGGGVGEAA